MATRMTTSSRRPIKTGQSKLYQTVARKLIAAIGDGRYPAGQRIPAERELAQEFGVSRPTVREAIIALEVQGLVEVRMGSGVYVLRATHEPNQPSDRIGAFELTEARLLFEGEAAALAATEMTDAQFDELDVLIELIDEENRRGVAGEEPDREFHLAIARGTGNGGVARTIDAVEPALDLARMRLAVRACAQRRIQAGGGGARPDRLGLAHARSGYRACRDAGAPQRGDRAPARNHRGRGDRARARASRLDPHPLLARRQGLTIG